MSAFATLVTAPPLRYGAGLGRGGESDGMAVWRILRGGPPRAARSGREPAVGLLLIGIFAVALVLQSEKTA